MKLVYWYCRCPDDHNSYSIRARTKREALAQREGGHYGKPVKVTVIYRDALDLLQQALGEGGVEPYDD